MRPILVVGAVVCTVFGSQSIANAVAPATPGYVSGYAGANAGVVDAVAPAPVVIDDFTTGAYTRTLTDSTEPVLAYQGGAGILGGARNTKLTNGSDPRRTPVTLDVGSANRLNLTVGADQEVRFDLSYGYTPAGGQAPLDFDITRYRAFVLHFHAVDTSKHPSWALLLHSGSSYSQAGGWIDGGSGPFAMEIPLTSFNHFAGTDDKHVNFITLIIQSKVDVGIDSIELI